MKKIKLSKIVSKLEKKGLHKSAENLKRVVGIGGRKAILFHPLIDAAFEKGKRVAVFNEYGDSWQFHKRSHTVKRYIGKRTIVIQLDDSSKYLPNTEHLSILESLEIIYSETGKRCKLSEANKLLLRR